MNAVNCARCGGTGYMVRLIAHGVDNVDVDGQTKFGIDPALLAAPDYIELEAICRSCSHARFVEREDWEWA